MLINAVNSVFSFFVCRDPLFAANADFCKSLVSLCVALGSRSTFVRVNGIYILCLESRLCDRAMAKRVIRLALLIDAKCARCDFPFCATLPVIITPNLHCIVVLQAQNGPGPCFRLRESGRCICAFLLTRCCTMGSNDRNSQSTPLFARSDVRWPLGFARWRPTGFCQQLVCGHRHLRCKYATWSTGLLSQARYALAATSVGSKALFAGGYTNGGAPSAVVDIYDSIAQTWTIASLSQARSHFAATSLCGIALFAGGATGSATATVPSAVVDIFDSGTSTWHTEPLSQARYGIAATSVCGIALFAGRK